MTLDERARSARLAIERTVEGVAAPVRALLVGRSCTRLSWLCLLCWLPCWF
jgi:hypothetical protein